MNLLRFQIQWLSTSAPWWSGGRSIDDHPGRNWRIWPHDLWLAQNWSVHRVWHAAVRWSTPVVFPPPPNNRVNPAWGWGRTREKPAHWVEFWRQSLVPGTACPNRNPGLSRQPPLWPWCTDFLQNHCRDSVASPACEALHWRQWSRQRQRSWCLYLNWEM